MVYKDLGGDFSNLLCVAHFCNPLKFFPPEDLNIPRYTKVNRENMETVTTLKIHEDTKQELDSFREYKNESYDEVIKKVVFIAKICKTEPELSRETVEAIEKARERIKRGKFLTEAEARKRLGL